MKIPVSIKLSRAVYEEINAKKADRSRSGFIEFAVVNYLRNADKDTKGADGDTKEIQFFKDRIVTLERLLEFQIHLNADLETKMLPAPDTTNKGGSFLDRLKFW